MRLRARTMAYAAAGMLLLAALAPAASASPTAMLWPRSDSAARHNHPGRIIHSAVQRPVRPLGSSIHRTIKPLGGTRPIGKTILAKHPP